MPVKSWIQKVERGINKRGQEGKFSAKAKRANMTTSAFAAKIIREYKAKKTHTKPQTKTYRQAILARTLMRL